MRKFYLFLTVAASAAMLALNSCAKAEVEDDNGENQEPDVEVPEDTVSFTAGINAPSRATDTKFDVSDEIGVFAVKSNGNDLKGILQSSGNYADNVKYAYNGTKFTSNNGIKIEDDGTKYFYHAVYPYTASARDEFSFDVMNDQSGSNYTMSDLCTAHTAATSQTSVDLKFSHRLSKVVVNLTGNNWPSGDYKLKLNDVYTSASVDLNDLTFTYGNKKGEVIMATNGNLSYKAVLPPQVLEKENFATLTIGDTDYGVTLNNRISLSSGMQHEISLTFNNNTVVVEFTGDIYPWGEEDERFDDVVPGDIREELGEWIPIYNGVNPPVVEGTYYVEPLVTVHCQDEGNGGYEPGEEVAPMTIRFSNQNATVNTIDYEGVSAGGSTGEGKGAFISGSGSNFTAFFNVVGSSSGIYTKTALVISGSKTSSGIANLYYAFVMVEKGDDPDGLLMKEGVFRVFKDEDGMSVNTTWAGARSADIDVNGENYYSVFSSVK